MDDLQYGKVLDLDMNSLQDYSGNSNDGIASGTSLTTDVYGRKDRARSFDGVDDKIELNSNIVTTTSYSVSLLFNNDVLPTSSTIYKWLFIVLQILIIGIWLP